MCVAVYRHHVCIRRHQSPGYLVDMTVGGAQNVDDSGLGRHMNQTAFVVLRWQGPRLAANEWPWLLGAVAFGGALGPLFLMTALARTPATTASLLLNLENVFTAVPAWVVFRENVDRRIVLGMALIVAGSAALAWPGAWSSGGLIGAVFVALACLAWAIDNNLTRKVAASDALFIAAAKGWIAGLVNVAVALVGGAAPPAPA